MHTSSRRGHSQPPTRCYILARSHTRRTPHMDVQGILRQQRPQNLGVSNCIRAQWGMRSEVAAACARSAVHHIPHRIAPPRCSIPNVVILWEVPDGWGSLHAHSVNNGLDVPWFFSMECEDQWPFAREDAKTMCSEDGQWEDNRWCFAYACQGRAKLLRDFVSQHSSR